MLFRKTLLALAVAATALPVSAQIVQLGNEGFFSQLQTHTDDLQFTGSFNGTNITAIELQGSSIAKDLVFDTRVQVSGRYATGALLTTSGDWERWERSDVGGNLLNKGNISAEGAASSAFFITASHIGGDVVNQGVLSASGEPAISTYGETILTETLYLNGTIGGNVINGASGKVIASGTGANGIKLEAADIGYVADSWGFYYSDWRPTVGKVINEGLIHVQGDDSIGINASHGRGWPYDPFTRLKSIENHGTILAEGNGAVAVNIDGVDFMQRSDHLVNTGLIQSSDTAIKVGDNSSYLYNPWGGNFAPVIVNSGTITAGKNAIESQRNFVASALLMEDGSKITGNLLGLLVIQATGNTEFTGTGNADDTPNIQTWQLRVGNDAAETPAHLNLLGAHTRVDGSLYLAGNSSLGLNLYSASKTDTPVLNVNGYADFGDGAKITLSAQGKDFDVAGSSYTLLKADRIYTEGQFDLTSTSALLKIDSYVLTDDRLVATVTGKSNDEISRLIGRHGGSLNGQRGVVALNTDGVINRIRQQNPNDPLLQTLLNTSEADLTRIAEQLAPETNGGATQAATTSQNLVSSVTGSRTSSLRGASSGEAFKEAGVWVQSLYSDATQDLRDGVAGYNAYSRGIAVGADGKLNDQLTLGLAYSFINTDVNGKSGNKTEVDSHAFTLYGGYELGNYFVDGSLTYGLNDNDGKRQIASTQAKASYDSDLLGLNLVGGYTWRINPQVLVEPRLAARYSLVNIDGYREKGSSAALKVEDQRYEAIELGAGVRVAGSFNLGAGTLEPQVKLMAYHDFAADQASSTSTFLLGNTPFVTTGAKAVRNSYEAGIGTDYKLGAITVGVNYDYIGKSGFDADVFSAKVRYDF